MGDIMDGMVWGVDGSEYTDDTLRQFDSYGGGLQGGKLIRFKYIAFTADSVLGIGDSTPTWPMNDGDDTGWIPFTNMDKMWYQVVTSGASGTCHWAIVWD